jgi:hypothetical protein
MDCCADRQNRGPNEFPSLVAVLPRLEIIKILLRSRSTPFFPMSHGSEADIHCRQQTLMRGRKKLIHKYSVDSISTIQIHESFFSLPLQLDSENSAHFGGANIFFPFEWRNRM